MQAPAGAARGSSSATSCRRSVGSISIRSPRRCAGGRPRAAGRLRNQRGCVQLRPSKSHSTGPRQYISATRRRAPKNSHAQGGRVVGHQIQPFARRHAVGQARAAPARVPARPTAARPGAGTARTPPTPAAGRCATSCPPPPAAPWRERSPAVARFDFRQSRQRRRAPAHSTDSSPSSQRAAGPGRAGRSRTARTSAKPSRLRASRRLDSFRWLDRQHRREQRAAGVAAEAEARSCDEHRCRAPQRQQQAQPAPAAVCARTEPRRRTASRRSPTPVARATAAATATGRRRPRAASIGGCCASRRMDGSCRHRQLGHRGNNASARRQAGDARRRCPGPSTGCPGRISA